MGDSERMYYYLSSFILILTFSIIIGSCFGLVFFSYKILFSSEKYIQFEDDKPIDGIGGVNVGERNLSASHVAANGGALSGITLDDLKKIEEAVNYRKSEINRVSDSTAEH